MYDVIIIGSGAAGISAALTLKLRNKNILWLGNPNLSAKISSAHLVVNYPGLNAVSGREMCGAFSAQIAAAGLEITHRRATGVYATGDFFTVLCGQDSFEGRSVIVATGVDSVKTIAGESEFLGRGVSYCATCDGFLYRGKTIAVICTDKALEEEVKFLSETAGQVYYTAVYKNAEINGDNVRCMPHMPVSIEGKGRVERICYGEESLPVDGAFILKSAVAPSVLVPGIKAEGGHIAVDRMQRTNIAGLFAAGDCTGRPYQYAKAAGEGNVAAHSACEYLAIKK